MAGCIAQILDLNQGKVCGMFFRLFLNRLSNPINNHKVNHIQLPHTFF